MSKSKSKKPSGLTITRNKYKFTVSWKNSEKKIEKQQLQVLYATSFINGSPRWHRLMVPIKVSGTRHIIERGLLWNDIDVGKSTTSKTVGLDEELAALTFRVRCKGEKKDYSDWAAKTWTVKTPAKPSVGMSVVNDLTSKFAWSSKNDNAADAAFVHNQYQTILAPNSNTSDGSKVTGKWSAISTTGASSGTTIEESGWNLVSQSRTRWLRVRAQGWCGLFSNWVYTRRIYAAPNPATDVKATRSAFKNSGYSVSVSWNSPETQARPIDTASVEYVKTEPIVTVTYPSSSSGTVTMKMSCPTEGLSWSSVLDTGGKASSRSAAFTDPESIPPDNCFYVRISNKHDNLVTSSTPVLANGGIGKLLAPSAPSAEPTGTPGLYSIAVNSRGTEIENAAIAIYFRTSSAQNKSTCIGIIPPGSSTVNCIIPEVPSGDSFAFGAQAFIGNYSPKEAPSGSTTVTQFKPTLTMKSDVTWGSAVPQPPTVTVEPVNDSTVQVNWNWSWTDATQAELSWADHADAWESTDEPQTYIVNSTNASSWRIAGLSVGTWYVRVRLLKATDDSVSYSAYSSVDAGIVKLSTSPDTPTLLLSSSVVSRTGTVTCYWAYVSGDGTGQRQAVICEAIPQYAAVESPTGNPYENVYYERTGDSEETYKYTRSFDTTVDPEKTYYQTTGEVTYGKEVPGGKVESAQHVTLSIPELGWLPGETHHLAVQVTSMSMETSRGWSIPVPITVADEPYISISSSSLQYRNDIPADTNTSDVVTEYRSAFSLTRFPLIFNIDGFSAGNKVTCIIDRAEDYPIERPDDTDYIGFRGETVLMKTYDTASIEINASDMIGMFDDGASYGVTLILSDAYGQNVSTSQIPTGVYNAIENPEGNPQENGWYVLVSGSYILTTDTDVVSGTTYYSKELLESFEVHWDHQAVMPSATVELDHDAHVTMITPIQPETGFAEGDVVDIYRLSADPPELIYSGAAMTSPGTKYVDPYPAFGNFGGHRIVYRTLYGDYITESNELAYRDYAANEDEQYKHDLFGVVIDFGNDQIVLPGNVSFSSKWSKDFETTKYLGGSIQGDWNPAVERSMSAKVTIPIEYERENIELIRRLAVYPGVCHVRTPDGSSFAANIDVNDDREEKWTTRLAQISLDITKCDPEGNDAITYTEWIDRQE